jgi:PAS domain S-box-containing protein
MLEELAKITERLRGVPDPLGLLGALFAHAPVGFQVWSASGHSLLTNAAFRELFGSEPPPEYNVLKDELAAEQGVLDPIRRAFAGETVRVGPFWYDPRELRQVTVREGRRVAIECTRFPLTDDSGAVQYVASVFKDVTAELVLREREQALRQNEERLNQALFAGRLVACELSLDGGPSSFSANAPEVLGCSEAQLSDAQQLVQLIHPDDRESARAAWKQLLELGQSGPDVQYRVVRPDTGATLWFERRLSVIKDEQGRVRGVRGLLIDVTERKRSEEIRTRSNELEFQNRRFQEANRLKSEFLANMSHELRTPLNAIIGFAELLYDGQVDPATPRFREFLGDIVSSGRHLLALINDVLDLAKVEAGKQEFRPEPVELDKLVGEVCAILRATALQKRIRLELELDASLSDIVIDPARFKQVLFNDLSNALKFTGEGGQVIVRTIAEDEHAFRLEVEDNGIGIAPGDIGRLFVEFQQLDTGAAKKHPGTGLGLVLTRRLVEAQGGAVGVRSALGQGSLFDARLPRRAPVRARSLPPPRSRTQAPGAQTIVVVEDELADQQLLTSTLSQAGYAVELAVNGAEALALCQLRRFHAVTLDLLLPDMSGLDLLAGIRAAGNNRDVPVIVVTVVPSQSAVSGFAVQDVLHKPVEPPQLLATLERAGVSVLGTG